MSLKESLLPLFFLTETETESLFLNQQNVLAGLRGNHFSERVSWLKYYYYYY